MINLYDHQSVMINGVRSKMQDHKSILLQSPTGSGKTIMALFIISSATAKNKTCFFICHRRELIDQTSKTFAKNNVEFGIIASGVEPDYSKKVQICSIDTLKNRLDLIPTPDLCLWDECLHGDTEIITNKGAIKIKDFDRSNSTHVLSYNGVCNTMQPVNGFRKLRKKRLIEISVNGKSILCTS